MLKLNYNDVIKSIYVICIGRGGYEYIAYDRYGDGKFDFVPKSILDREDKVGIRNANKTLAQWKKGIRKLMKVAKQGPGAMAMMAKGYTGNGPSSNYEWFWKLHSNMSSDQIIELGEGKSLRFETYVNGEVDVWLE